MAESVNAGTATETEQCIGSLRRLFMALDLEKSIFATTKPTGIASVQRPVA